MRIWILTWGTALLLGSPTRAASQALADCEPSSKFGAHVRDSLLDRAWWAFEGENASIGYVSNHIRRAIELGPPPARRWSTIAMMFSAYNRPDTAVALMQSAVVQWPKCVTTYVGLSRIYQAFQRDSLASMWAVLATTKFPGSAYAWAGSGDMLMRLGNPAAAAAHFRRAITLTPSLLKYYPEFRYGYDSLVTLHLLPAHIGMKN